MSRSGSLEFSTVLAASVHDMKNSIGMLVHLVEEVRQRVPDHEEDFGQLQYEATRLNTYLVQLMTLYKLEQAQYRSLLEEHYLDEFLEDLLLMVRPTLAPRGVELEQHVSAELCWTFDAPLVLGVLASIVSNVIRYVDCEVRACAGRVRVSAENRDGGLWLRVEDDGPGFPESMLGPLEEREMGVDFISGSTGFGLYFALQVAGLHRNDDRSGHVRLSNGGALGGGCFELFLP